MRDCALAELYGADEFRPDEARLLKAIEVPVVA